MALTVDQVGKALVASGLLTAEELKALWNGTPANERPKDGDGFTKLLIKQDRLSEFQAQELLSGSGTPLVLNQYVLLSKIGAGGMGQVFKAQHRKMKRLAAIKLLPAALAKDEAAVKRFQREVEAAAKLSHPNIVQTFDADECRGIHYMVMEYVEGQDLSAIVKERGPLPVQEAVDYILQAARGLAFAHGKGVVHRDIKPANLLLDSEGVVKILDMGLARIDDGNTTDHQLTNTGTVMGTVDYMPPEQANDTRKADARSDVYSLGCSLYRLITGESVFGGETVVQKIMAHMGDPIPSLLTKRPDCPAEIDRIFQKMLAKRPDDRYQQAAQVVVELEAWKAPRSEAATSASLPSDPQLSNFLQSINQPKGTATSTVQPSLQTVVRTEQTMTYAGPELDTDPKSEVLPSLVTATKPSPTATKPKVGGKGGKKPPVKLIAAGAAGFLFLLLGVILVIKNDKGETVAEVKVPEGNSVEVKVPAGGSVQVTPDTALAKPTSQQLVPTTSKSTAPGGDDYALAFENTGTNATQWVEIPTLHWNQGEFLTIEGYFDCDDSAQGQHILFEPDGGGIFVKCGVELIEAVAKLPGGKWHLISTPTKPRRTHVALVIGGAEFHLFVNGRKKSEALPTSLDESKYPEFVIGASSLRQLSNGFHGLIDEVRISKSARYAADFEPKNRLELDGDTLALYHFDEGSGDILRDSSPNHHDGKIVGAKWVRADGSPINSLPSAAAPPLAVAPFTTAQAKNHQQAWAKHLGTEVETVNSVGAKMVLIPPGEFMMGSTPEQIAAALKTAAETGTDQNTNDRISKSEAPQHRVAIAKPFRIGATEVTVGEFAKFVTATGYKTEAEQEALAQNKQQPTPLRPGVSVTLDSPATWINWTDARAYCRWLSDQEKTTYRLPTEAEWEYACRAGTVTQYSFGDDHALLDQYAWHAGNADRKPHPVGTKLPNAFGLYDMHGNLYEFCQDIWNEEAYRSPNVTATSGPAANLHPLRGGDWKFYEILCRSASRYFTSQYHEGENMGFRVVQELDAPEKTASVTPTPGVPAASGKLFMHDPAFPQWLKDVQALPAAEQIEAVSKKLMELNPGFDGKLSTEPPIIDGEFVTLVRFNSNEIQDISPLRALRQLKTLACTGQPGNGKLSDLSPLQGMALTKLVCNRNRITDLSPLSGMPLEFLECYSNHIPDMTPLKGMPLQILNCSSCPVWDLSPLNGMHSLKHLYVLNSKTISPGSIAALQKVLPNCKIEWDDPTKATTRQSAASTKLFMHDPAFPQWMKDVQAMPAEEQIKAVSKKLVELNPGFDGKVTGPKNSPPKLEDGVITELNFNSNFVTDISPVRALVGLKNLIFKSTSRPNGGLSDLSPLEGLNLEYLSCGPSQVSDLSPLHGMDMRVLYMSETKVSDLSPLRGLPLRNLQCNETPVSDLSPLKGMPLTILGCHSTAVSDLSPLEECTSLTTLLVTNTKVTPATVAALQKALPNCKIEWDDPAKATTPQPTANSTDAK